MGSAYLNGAINKMYDWAYMFLKHNKVEFCISFFIFHVVYDLTLVPGHTYFFVLMAYLLKDLWLSFFIILGSYEVAVVIGYFGIKFFFYDKFKKAFNDDYRFRLVYDS